MRILYLFTLKFLLISFMLISSSCEKFEMADEGGYELHKSGNLVAMTTNNGCKIWDVSDPAKAKLLSRIPVGYSHGVIIKENTIFISSEGTLHAYDISEPGSPEKLGSVSCSGGGLFEKGNLLFVKDYSAVYIVNCADPEKMIIIGKYQFGYTGNGTGIYARDGFIYTTNDKLWQLKYNSNGQISDPKSYISNTWRLVSDGNYIYLSTYDRGIIVVDISDPTNVRQVCALNCGATWEIAISPGFVYVIDQYVGPRRIDINNFSNPIQLQKISDSYSGHDLIYDNGYLFCAGWKHGFYILDANDLSVVFN